MKETDSLRRTGSPSDVLDVLIYYNFTGNKEQTGEVLEQILEECMQTQEYEDFYKYAAWYAKDARRCDLCQKFIILDEKVNPGKGV